MRRLALLLMTFTLPVSHSLASPSLSNAIIHVSPLAGTPGSWSVSIEYQITGARADDQVSFRAIRFPDQSFQMDPVSGSAPTRDARSTVFSVRLRQPDASVVVEYEVLSGGDPRVPLFVPEFPINAPVQITVELADHEWSGGMMPSLLPQQDGEWTRDSAHFPGFLYLPIRASGSAGASLPISMISDWMLLSMLVLGSFYWWHLRRRARAELREQETGRQ